MPSIRRRTVPGSAGLTVGRGALTTAQPAHAWTPWKSMVPPCMPMAQENTSLPGLRAPRSMRVSPFFLMISSTPSSGMLKARAQPPASAPRGRRVAGWHRRAPGGQSWKGRAHSIASIGHMGAATARSWARAGTSGPCAAAVSMAGIAWSAVIAARPKPVVHHMSASSTRSPAHRRAEWCTRRPAMERDAIGRPQRGLRRPARVSWTSRRTAASEGKALAADSACRQYVASSPGSVSARRSPSAARSAIMSRIRP